MAGNGKRTKGQNKAIDRRIQRHREKNGEIKRDIMLGATVRRGWGIGIAKVRGNKNHGAG